MMHKKNTTVLYTILDIRIRYFISFILFYFIFNFLSIIFINFFLLLDTLWQRVSTYLSYVSIKFTSVALNFYTTMIARLAHC